MTGNAEEDCTKEVCGFHRRVGESVVFERCAEYMSRHLVYMMTYGLTIYDYIG